jgi:gamma-glutamylputrescine oxidase
LNRDFNYSYWERDQYFRRHDLIVVGSGIVGLSTAISFIGKHPKANVLVLDRGFLPEGASTKNAGFACFGSPGELLADLRKTDEDTVWETVRMRWQGLKLLRSRLGDRAIDYQALGGYELFTHRDQFEQTADRLESLNRAVKVHLGLNRCYNIDKDMRRRFPGVAGVIRNRYEGQIDTGIMMRNLLRMAQSKGVVTLNNVSVISFAEERSGATIATDKGIFTARTLVVATNGFATQLLELPDIRPARAQVLVTAPLKRIPIRGCFHFDEGYYYFRNVGDRILFGGGRNLDPEGETTHEFELSALIQSRLDALLSGMILKGRSFRVESRWSGIMGVGREKMPIIKPVGRHTVAAVRMGGMGVAIGSMVGKLASEQATGLLSTQS